MGKTKRDRIRERLMEAFIEYESQSLIPRDAEDKRGHLVDTILDAIQDPPPKPKKSNSSPSATMEVFTAWSQEIEKRTGFLPIRNASLTRMCSELVGKVGAEKAPPLARFFVSQNDAFYLRTGHDIVYLLRDYHTILMRMETGKTVTSASAKKTEVTQATVAASKSYLERKYGNEANR